MGIKHKTLISIGFVLDAIFAALRAAKKPTNAAMIVGLMYLHRANYVWASSGGMMGGSDWDLSSDSSSYSSPSSSDDSSSYSYSSLSSTHSSYQCSSCGSSSLQCSSCDEPNSQRPESSSDTVPGFLVFAFASGIMIIIAIIINNNSTQKTSVIKLQVGLFGNIRTLQNALNQIARTADTSTRGGMRSVLTGTLESLIAHHRSCISAYTSLNILSNIGEGKKMFNQLSRNEQGKFDEETLVNVNNVRRERTESIRFDEASDMYLVITILVAAQGRLEMYNINTCEELVKALRQLQSIPESKTMAVQVLWTPQQELDTLSREQLREDYPHLRPL